jgi:hypothetical protein
MRMEWKKRIETAGWRLAAVALALAIGGVAAVSRVRQEVRESKVPEIKGKFYCNVKALTPAEWARHREVSEKMLAARTAIVETEKGYELQFNPDKISVGEVAEWVTRESKCCPFFDFHIDLENRGTLICLRLTGEEGVKAFIRNEFHVGQEGGKK